MFVRWCIIYYAPVKTYPAYVSNITVDWCYVPSSTLPAESTRNLVAACLGKKNASFARMVIDSHLSRRWFSCLRGQCGFKCIHRSSHGPIIMYYCTTFRRLISVVALLVCELQRYDYIICRPNAGRDNYPAVLLSELREERTVIIWVWRWHDDR